MNCVIIDDDFGCIEALKSMIEIYCPDLKLEGYAQNLTEGVKILHKVHPDILFLDVEIGSETGFDLFKLIPNPDFEVVFTTAYEKYALKAIKSSCFDFLLKPIATEELVAVVTHFKKEKNPKNEQNIKVLLDNFGNRGSEINQLAIPSNSGYSFVRIEEIIMLEGDRKYTRIFTKDGQNYLSTKNIGEFESLLPQHDFFRTHKSWLVNLKCLKKFDRNSSKLFLEGGLTAEVSIRKREEFMKIFGKV